MSNTHDPAVPSSRAAPSGFDSLLRPLMPELDSVRGIAVLAVVVYHGVFWTADTTQMSQPARAVVAATQPGWLGVQLFFVLSGFLITGILLDTKSRGDYFRRFYRHRAARILPAYLALLLLLALLGQAQWPFLVASLLFAANLTSVFGIPMQYGPLWSLAVEEQFYLFWPLIVRYVSRRTLAIVCLGIVLLTPVLRLIAFTNGAGESLYSRTWFVSDGLALGALLALVVRSHVWTRERFRVLTGSLLFAGATMLLVGIPWGILHRTNAIGAALQLAPWHLLFGGVVAGSLLIGTSPFASLTRSRTLSFFGRISYGLYLIHLLVFQLFDALMRHLAPTLALQMKQSIFLLLIRLLVAGGLAAALAWLSRETMEEAFIRLGRRDTTRPIPILHQRSQANRTP